MSFKATFDGTVLSALIIEAVVLVCEFLYLILLLLYCPDVTVSTTCSIYKYIQSDSMGDVLRSPAVTSHHLTWYTCTQREIHTFSFTQRCKEAFLSKASFSSVHGVNVCPVSLSP